MALTLAEAIVVLKSSGLEKLSGDLRQPKSQLDQIAQAAQKAEGAIGSVGKKKVGDIGANALVGDLNKVSRGFADIEQAVGGLGIGGTSSLGRLASGLSAVTSSAGLLAGAIAAAGVAAGVAFGAVATQAASRLQTNMANVATISKDVAQNFNQVTRQVSDLAVAANTRSNLLSAGLYQTISAGITDTSEAMKFLEASANAAKAGLTSVEIAVDGLSSVTNAFGIQASQVTEISDKFFKAVELGKFTFGELAASIGTVAPLASSLGVSLDDLLASGAALTLTGLSLSESFTGIRQALQGILKPTSEAKEVAQSLGIQFEGAALRTQGFIGFLAGLKNNAGVNVEVLGKLFGSVEALNAVLALTGKQSDTASRFLGEIKNSAGATNNALEIIKKTLDDNVALMKNEWTRLLEKAGLTLLPAVTAGVKAWAAALHSVNDALALNSALQNLPKGLAPPSVLLGTGIRPPIEPMRPTVEKLTPPRVALSALEGEIPSIERPLAVRRPVMVPSFLREPSIKLPEADVFLTQQEIINQQVEQASQLFEDWGKRAENAYVSAGVQLQTFLILLQRQGISMVNGLPLIPQHSEAWRKAFAVITPLQVKNVENIRKQSAGFLDLVSVLGKGSTNIGNAFKMTGDAISKTITEGIAGIQKQNEVFLAFTAEIEDRGIQAQASLLEIEGKSLEARLLLLDHELMRKRQAIDEDVKNHAAAERLKTQLSETGARERAAIILSEIEKVKISPIGFEGITPTGQELQPQAEGEKRLTGFAAALNEVKVAGRDTIRSFHAIEDAIQGGKAGGVVGAITAFGISLLMETEGFKKIMDSFDRLLGSLVKALEPLMKALAPGLTALLDGLGELLEGLTPIFELLGQVISLTIGPLRALGNILGGVGDFFKDIFGGGEKPLADRPIEEQKKFAQELANRRKEFARLRAAGKLPADIAALPPAFQLAAFVKQGGPIKAQVFPEGKQLGPLGRIKAEEGEGEEEKRTVEERPPTQGIQISMITGPTRDILVAALSPLKQLDTTFPAMLDELRQIRQSLTGKKTVEANGGAAPGLNAPIIQLPEGIHPAFDMPNMLPIANVPDGERPANDMQHFMNAVHFDIPFFNQNPVVQIPRFNAAPEINMPDFSRFHAVGDNEESIGEMDFIGNGGDSISITGGITIQVQQVADISIDEIDRQLQRELKLHRRAVGNRGRIARIT